MPEMVVASRCEGLGFRPRAVASACSSPRISIFKRQVLQRKNFSSIVSMAADRCQGRSKAVMLQELRALQQSANP